MNFPSSFGALPTIATRKALLLLDFQNDFIRPSGALHVSNTADFLENIPQLVNAFRRSGDVIWVRSHYESPQPLVDSDFQDRIVLARAEDGQRRKQRGGPPPGGPVDEEAFLSTESSQCCRPQTPGFQFPAPIFAAINAELDTLLEKSDYSALQDDGMVFSFRTRLITHLYICGSLSNISVYATVLDAVRHGFSVTLIEDCLGFRSFNRHEEAMRRMADIFGASGITTQELSEELDWQETDAIARQRGPSPPWSVTPAGIEGVLDELDFKSSRTTTAQEERPESSSSGSRRRRVNAVLADLVDGEETDLFDLVKLSRPRSRYGPSGSQGSASQAQGASGDKKSRVRVRRSRRQDQVTQGENARSGKSKPQDCRGPGDKIGEGDSRIIHDIDLPSNAFEQIHSEVAWQKMYHLSGQVPRLVAVQGRFSADGSIPIYRHPADESPPLQPFTSTVDQVRVIVERILGHPLNHVLIQLYRDGQDYISEHSDKTLDIARGSSICNVSLGAQRVMVLRTKTKASDEGDSTRLSQRVPMPHESLFILGEKTNMRWLHGIRADKRPGSEKSAEERGYGGERISLTFRRIGTFLDPAGDRIWGQGAVSKDQNLANPVIHGDPVETERLIRAFGQENHASDFDWAAVYGGGFDVVNFVTAATAKLVLGQDAVANLRVQLALSENGLRYDVTASVDDAETSNGTVHSDRPLYIAADGTKVAGDVKIMTYLAQRSPETTRPGVDMLRGGSQLPQIDELLMTWRENQNSHGQDKLEALIPWEKALEGKHYLGGTVFGIDDCSLWPVLREIVQEKGPFSTETYPNLAQYYLRVEKRGIVKVTLEEMK